MENIKNHARGIALALTVSGIVPGIACAALLSCDWLLDALPWACAGLLAALVAALAAWDASEGSASWEK